MYCYADCRIRPRQHELVVEFSWWDFAGGRFYLWRDLPKAMSSHGTGVDRGIGCSEPLSESHCHPPSEMRRSLLHKVAYPLFEYNLNLARKKLEQSHFACRHGTRRNLFIDSRDYRRASCLC
jgi:hypothetical protein